MANLKGLAGLSQEEIECLFIYEASDIKCILNNSKAGTAAGDNGAINVWYDDDRFIRCEAQRYCNTVESKKFKTFAPAIRWVAKWMDQIK